jgi:hypothetical protein
MTFKITNTLGFLKIATATLGKDNHYIAMGNTNQETLHNLFNKIYENTNIKR